MNKKPSILFVVPDKMSKTTQMIADEARQEFEVEIVPLYELAVGIEEGETKIIHEGREIGRPDYVFPRIDSKRAAYGFDIINAFEHLGIKKPYSARTLLVAHDKFLTSLVLSRYGIPMPRTYLAKTKGALLELSRRVKFPVMMKLLSGYGGKGVMYVKDRKAMDSIMSSLELLGQHVVLQEFVENPGEDMRVLVAGDNIVGAMKRVAKSGEKRANITAGGTGVRLVPGDEVRALSIKAARALGADICAIDLIEGPGGPVVIEANINYGIQGLAKATDSNIAKGIVEFLAGEIKGAPAPAAKSI